ncbi:MAG: hypothetical protein J6K29_03725 [Clostridia bacterium]|nr:hypothetical protein [Clostridia bacterium]
MRKLYRIWLPAALLLLLLILAACTTDTSAPPATEGSTLAPSDAVTDGTTEPAGTEAPTDETTAPADTEAPTEPEETLPANPDITVAAPDKLDFSTSVTVTANGGSATVSHEDGLTYTATGFSSAEGNTLTFEKGLTLTFDPASTAEAFNRFTLGYTSTQPLYGKITYTSDSKAVTDDFYMEAGTHTFSCVIGRYLDGIKGTGIRSMTLETCNDRSADFALCVMQTQDYPVYGENADTYYIENARYKLGIRLIWGGGINYLEDKTCTVNRLKNLVNQADTGRLIQQSYYGVQQNAEYTPGNYNGSTWAYNPVQGGDVKGNHSRIIDIVVNEYSVYVKSQPLDWAKDNSLTPSYMENTYTVYADRIRVDNRFVDFSNWTHRYAHQELPAFYTVSYLSRFTLYNGAKPWTDDTMSYRDDLGFWGDSTYYNDCTFLLKNSNTETWCAWTNPGDDFGIGLYVPNVDSYLAGRHAFNNSKESTNGATNYVAPINAMMLKSFEAVEYSYLISTGSVADMRGVFKEHKDFASNATLHENHQTRRVSDNTAATNENSYADLNGGGGGGGNGGAVAAPLSAHLDLTKKENASHVVASSNTVVSYDASAGALSLTVKGEDPHVTVVYDGKLSADQYKTVEITYMLPASNSAGNNVTDLFLCAGSISNPTADACVRMDLTADGQYHTLTVDLSGKSFWQGDIHKIRFDYLDGCEAGDVMYVQSIVLK